MTEMKDLGKELFFFAWLKGTDEDFSLTLALPSGDSLPHLGERRNGICMKTDQKVAQPAPSPQAGEVVFSGTGWPGGKVRGKRLGATAAGSAAFPAGSPALCLHTLQAAWPCPLAASPLF